MSLFTIKITAMVTMAVDHLAYGMLYATGLAFSDTGMYVLYNVMRIIGRLSFPLFAFAVTEGYRHTKDFKKYLLRLFVLACITVIPYSILSSGTALGAASLNSVFLFCIGLSVLKINDLICKRFKNGLLSTLLICLTTGFGCYAAWLFKIDYGAYGLLFILCLYYCKERPAIMWVLGGILIFMAEGMIVQGIAAWAAFPFIAKYNGEKGKNMGIVPYVFYPAHMILIIISENVLNALI